jgi:hypothetical protein
MAPVGENVQVNGFSAKKKDETDNKENLWYVYLRSRTKFKVSSESFDDSYHVAERKSPTVRTYFLTVDFLMYILSILFNIIRYAFLYRVTHNNC